MQILKNIEICMWMRTYAYAQVRELRIYAKIRAYLYWNPGCIPVGSERFFFLPLNVCVEGSEGVCKSSEQQVFFDQIVQVLVSHFQISKNRQKFSTHNMSKWNV